MIQPIAPEFFHIMSMTLLAKICAIHYLKTDNQTISDKLIRHIFGDSVNDASIIFNRRMTSMSETKKKEMYRLVWSQPSALNWGRKYFENPEKACDHFVYHAIFRMAQSLQRPIKCLELGCVSGGSYFCLRRLKTPVSLYCGIDISAEAISEGLKNFSDDKNVDFIQSDFLEYIANTDEHFDVILIKDTAMYLDEPYFRSLLNEISTKKISDYIAIQEVQLNNMDENYCVPTDWNWTPQTYSFNYTEIFDTGPFKIIDCDHIHRADRPNFMFRGMVKIG